MMRPLQEAIFGGPRLERSGLLSFLQEFAIHLPARVIATGTDESGPRNAVPVRLHPGLTYWFQPVAERQTGASICHSADHLIGAIQRAILQHRRQELSSGNISTISELAEAQAFHLALGAIRNRSEHSEELLDQWMEILLHRHQARINEIRRRMIEFLSALTRGVEAPIGYPFYSAVLQIYETFRLRDLTDLFRRTCREMSELIAGRSRLYASGHDHSEAVSKGFRFMEANFTKPIGLQEVATAVYVSPSHFSRLFRKESGRTVVEYLHSLRITHARELLATTEKTTLDIALESGFESVEHFYRLFRRLTGTTPRNYRITRRS